jgi:hypothetical protein
MRIAISTGAFILACFLAGCAEGPRASSRAGEPLDAEVRQTSWAGQGQRGWRLQTANYSICTTASGGDTAAILPAFMEASYRNYHRLTGLPYRASAEPLAIYLMGTREEWASLTQSILGPRADTALHIEAGGYCHAGVCIFWQLGGSAMLSVAAHEGLHQFLGKRLLDQLPMWVEEGLCTQVEAHEMEAGRVVFDPSRNLSRLGDLEGALISGMWTPIAELLPMDAGDAVTAQERKAVGYYGQLWALIRFIRSDPATSAGLDRLLADAEAGRLNEALGVPPEALAELRAAGRAYNQSVSEKLFCHYITDDLPRFEKRYKDYCYRLCKMKS